MVPDGLVPGKLKGKGNSVVSNGPPPKAVRGTVLTDITNTHQPSQPSKFDGLQGDFGDLQKEHYLLFPHSERNFHFIIFVIFL